MIVLDNWKGWRTGIYPAFGFSNIDCITHGDIVQTINEVHHMRYFFRPELEIIDNLDCQRLEETDYNSWTSYFVAKAV